MSVLCVCCSGLTFDVCWLGGAHKVHYTILEHMLPRSILSNVIVWNKLRMFCKLNSSYMINVKRIVQICILNNVKILNV